MKINKKSSDNYAMLSVELENEESLLLKSKVKISGVEWYEELKLERGLDGVITERAKYVKVKNK